MVVRARDLPAPVADLALRFTSMATDRRQALKLIDELKVSKDWKLVALLMYERLAGVRCEPHELYFLFKS